jgi:DNA adenine methylase
VEPFCGGLAICFGLKPREALINDLNPHLINFYRWLKKGLEVSIRMVNDEKHYYKSRNRFNILLKLGMGNCKEAASLFYYLNRTCYNGLCRFNRKGEFNVPFGKYEKINYVRDFSEYRALFANWEFTNTDFKSIPLARTDFVYADPPYDVEFTQYSKEKFGWEDQVRTAEWLSHHKGPVLISNQATERILALYTNLGFRLHLLPGPRRISCTGDRKPAMEVLASKNLKDDFSKSGNKGGAE